MSTLAIYAALATLTGITGWLAWGNARTRHRDVVADLNAMLADSEAERLQLRAHYQRHRAEAAQRRGQETPKTPGSWRPEPVVTITYDIGSPDPVAHLRVLPDEPVPYVPSEPLVFPMPFNVRERES